MSKFLGVCVVAAAALGAAVIVRKCLDAPKKDTASDNKRADNLSATNDTQPAPKSKADEMFEQAAVTLDEMRASTTDFCKAIKEILTANAESIVKAASDISDSVSQVK